MSIFSSPKNSFFESLIGDLCVRSVLGLEFYQYFMMSPELHIHSYYELLFAVEGGFIVDLSDGRQIEVREGDLCLTPPAVYHGTKAVSERSKKLGLRFRYEQIAHVVTHDSVYDQFHQAMSACEGAVLITQPKGMCNLFAILQHEVLGQEMAKQAFVSATLSQIYLLLLRKISNLGMRGTTPKDAEYFDEQEQRRIVLEDYFDQYFDQPITEEHLAQKMYLSKRQVSRILHDIYGKSFRQLLIDTRMNRALQLLESTALPLDEIVASVGYTSLSGFCSAFKQTFGMTAGQYRCDFLKKH